MIDVNGVSVGYDDQKIVEDMNFHIEKGEFFGILGPNGSGKTTLLKAMTGLLPLMEGVITLKGSRFISFLRENWLPMSRYYPRYRLNHFLIK